MILKKNAYSTPQGAVTITAGSGYTVSNNNSKCVNNGLVIINIVFRGSIPNSWVVIGSVPSGYKPNTYATLAAAITSTGSYVGAECYIDTSTGDIYFRASSASSSTSTIMVTGAYCI